MGFLSTGMFWGVVLVLCGLAVLLKAFFGIDIPIIRVLFGLFLIYLGAKVIWGPCTAPKPPFGSTVVTGGRVEAGKDREYNVIFGQGTIDLTGVEVKDQDLELKANTIFGSSTVKVKAGTPALIKASSAFGNAKLPGGDSTAFGTLYYKTASYKEGKPHLSLEVNAVFGETLLVVEE